jgi:hypothetical protein
MDREIARIHRWILGLTVAGAFVAFTTGGWRSGVGFLLGALASYVNFRWLRKLVDSLGQAASGKLPRSGTAVVLGLRYLLFGAAAYVILRFSALSLTAALIGLFVSVAAVILEILFELIYAGT